MAFKLGGRLQDGKKLFILGLTEENLERLRDGKPFFAKLDELGGDGAVAIVFGKREKDLLEQLQPYLPIGWTLDDIPKANDTVTG